MINVFETILVLIIVGLLWVVWKCYQKNEGDKKEILALEKERDEYAAFGSGLDEYNKKMQEKKNQMKAKILEMLSAKKRISNREVVKNLNISSASVRRYFDDLEAEGKVKQVGKDGKNVVYKAI
ncbi:MAG: winged helix-turn-helix domain-containing protein [Patescibacteria group bacterium]